LLLFESFLQAENPRNNMARITMSFIKLNLLLKLLNVLFVGKVFKRDPIRVLTS
jgi:hypothetical protein